MLGKPSFDRASRVLFLEKHQQVLVNLIFALDIEHTVQLFVSPIQVPVQLQQLDCGDRLEKIYTAPFIAATVLQSLGERLTDVLFDTEVNREIKFSEFFGVEAVNSHVHLVELGSRRSELFIVVCVSHVLLENELVKELEELR